MFKTKKAISLSGFYIPSSQSDLHNNLKPKLSEILETWMRVWGVYAGVTNF